MDLNIRPNQRYTIIGIPIVRIPSAVRCYPDFLTWWHQAGRLTPLDHKGWSTISGPGVMRNKTELISSEVWESLPESEKELIRQWAETLPLGVLYD